MASPILILHAPDADIEAALISEKLQLSGFSVLTFLDATGKASRLEIDEARYELIQDRPAIIVLASPGLLNDEQLVQMALIGCELNTFIPVLLRHIPEKLPVWFQNPINLNWDGKSDPRGWNLLLNSLLHKVGNLFWQYPESLKPRII